MKNESVLHKHAPRSESKTIRELQHKLRQHEEIIVQLVEIIGATNRQISELLDRQHQSSSPHNIRSITH